MKFSPKMLAAAAIATASLSLVSCSAPNGYSYANIGITISAYCSDCPFGVTYSPAAPQPPAAGSVLFGALGGGQGGTVQLTATVANAPAGNVSWSIYPSPNLTIPNPPPTSSSGSPGAGGSAVGTFSTPDGNSNTTASGGTVYYSMPGSIPIYSGAALQQAEALGIPQGDVLIVATAPSDPSNPSATISASQLIQVFNSNSTTPTVYLSPAEPSTPAGLTVSVATVAHNGGTFQFYGGVVGEQPCTTTSGCLIQGTQFPLHTADNSAVWEISPTTNVANATSTCNNPADTVNQPASKCPFGWISSTGLYTAPPAIPTSANYPASPGLAVGQVSIVVASHFLPTITKFAYITIN